MRKRNYTVPATDFTYCQSQSILSVSGGGTPSGSPLDSGGEMTGTEFD